KTSCLIGDENAVLGTGSAGGSNVVRVGEAQARESLASAIRQACTVAKVKASEITRVCVGLAGAARAEVSQPVRAMISEMISDEGSGHWIGRTAIAACLRAWDENHTEHAPMLDGLMKSWKIDSRERLVLAANATPPPDFAALFPSVLALADSGDPVARDVLAR